MIRDCRAEDYRRIWEINFSAFGYEYPLEKTRVRLEQILARPTDRLFVACEGDAVVGYIHVADYECTYADPQKNILSLAVDERWRGRGYGRMLLEAAEDWARAEGCGGVRLVSGMNREGAHGFYEKCGYVNRKLQKNFVKRFEG